MSLEPDTLLVRLLLKQNCVKMFLIICELTACVSWYCVHKIFLFAIICTLPVVFHLRLDKLQKLFMVQDRCHV